MTDLHPHWQSTGDEDSVFQKSDPGADPRPAAVHISVKPAARLPGAIAGIAVFTVVGITLAGGWQALTAQIGGGSPAGGSPSSTQNVSLPPVEMRISASDGFQPATITVRPGQQIVWINDQSIPHIITSQTLRDASGAYLNTPAIFPGGQVTFTVGPSEPDRQHTITSTTDQTLVGTVIVSEAGSASSGKSSSHRLPLGSLDGVKLPTGQGKMKIGGAGSSKSSKTSAIAGARKSSSSTRTVSTPPAAPAQIVPPSAPPPVPPTPAPNPFAGNAPPGTPVVTLDAFAPHDTPYTAPIPAPRENIIAPDTPVVHEQPNTGPGLWAVCIMSIAVLWRMTRKYFVKIA